MLQNYLFSFQIHHYFTLSLIFKISDSKIVQKYNNQENLKG